MTHRIRMEHGLLMQFRFACRLHVLTQVRFACRLSLPGLLMQVAWCHNQGQRLLVYWMSSTITPSTICTDGNSWCNLIASSSYTITGWEYRCLTVSFRSFHIPIPSILYVFHNLQGRMDGRGLNVPSECMVHHSNVLQLFIEEQLLLAFGTCTLRKVVPRFGGGIRGILIVEYYTPFPSHTHKTFPQQGTSYPITAAIT